ncbi:hypothetical protein MSM1_06670 [Mycobacterium sp. SM1]|uniref:hypothetical protein n=1 Tax=Mycobacterium sp. SM1 TaxID=2816243 RepID=UPI001BCFB619|nr:hypothetical protein [Mycobacterium sp. SM1]MBS4728046.1 hypothetical protein [Mycobacterium sp. SM1]
MSVPPGAVGPPPAGFGSSPQPGFGAPPLWAPAPVPPRRAGRGMWLWGGAALLVVAVTALITVVVLRGGRGAPAAGPSGAAGAGSGVASAADTGPVGIITEEPTCEKWLTIWTVLSDREHNGWADRDPSLPASAWTPEQRTQYQAVAQAMRSAADQTLPLVRLTPHRVVRELYEAFIAYGRAYAEKIPTYTAPDDHLAGVSSSMGNALMEMCRAIANGAAATSASVVSAAAPPTASALHGAGPADAADPREFLTKPDPTCADWVRLPAEFGDNPNLAALDTVDSNTPAGQRTPEQKAIVTAAVPAITSFADRVEALGRRSANLPLQDFAVLSAQYYRAYAAALPSYAVEDKSLVQVPTGAVGGTVGACSAVGGR